MGVIEDRLALVRGAIDREWAEAFYHRVKQAPLDVNGPAITDQVRETKEILGIFAEKGERLATPNAYDLRTARRPGVASSVTRIYVWRIDEPGLPPEQRWIKKGDLLERKRDGAVFEVSAIEPYGRQRLMCFVNRLGG